MKLLNMKLKNNLLNLGGLLYSILVVSLLKYLLPNSFGTYANSIIPIFVIVFVLLIFYHFKTILSSKVFFTSFILGFIFSVFLIFGKQLYYNGFIDYTDPLLYLSILVFGILIGMIISFTTCKFSYLNIKLDFLNKFLEKKFSWYLMYLFIIIIWSIYWLSYYPGIVDGDNTYYFWMFTTKQFTSHHPILHVLLLGNLFEIGNKLVNNYNFGVSIYIWFQMVFCSLVLVSFIYRLYTNRKINSLIVLLSIVFYSGVLLPIIPMNMITTTKDAIFSTVFFAFLILNFEFIDNFDIYISKKSNIIMYFFFGFLFLSFRNNALYAYLVFIVTVSIKLILTRKYIPIVIMLSLVLTHWTINSTLNNVFNVQSTTKYTEMMSVPLQGLARSYVRNISTWSTKDKLLLFAILNKNDVENYNPYWSDIVKNRFNEVEFSRDPKLYIELFLGKIKSNPTIFFDSFLENTLFSWYPFSINEPRYTLYNRNLSEPDSNMSFITDVNKPALLESKFPKLYSILQEISLGTQISKIPLYNLLFSIGFMFWTFLYSFKLSITKRNTGYIYFHMFALIYFLTLMLGPVMFIRYFLFLWFLFPISINSLFISEK